MMNYDYPFIHLFATKKHKYVYDVNSNDILLINDILFDILHLQLQGILKNDIKSILYDYYDRSEVERNFQFVENLIENKLLFSNKRPQKISMFCCEQSMKHHYDNYLSQFTLEVTQRCNLACKYCSYSGIYKRHRKHNNLDMSWDIAKAGLDLILSHGGRNPSDSILKNRSNKELTDFSIGFYGGEPLLNIKLIDYCLSYVKNNANNKKILFSLTTNGTILSEDIIDYLFKNNIAIVLSFDGPKEIHDRARVYHDGSGTHNKVINAIQMINRYARKYLEQPFSLRINCVVIGGIDYTELLDYFVSLEYLLNNDYVNTEINLSSMTDGLAKWNEAYPDNKLSLPGGKNELVMEYEKACLNDSFNNEDWANNFRLKLLHEFVFKEFYFDIHARTRYQYANEFVIPSLSHPGSICKIGCRRPYLMANGTILPCERVPTNDKNFHIGDYKDGLNLKKIKRLLDDFTNSTIEDCRNCWCYRFCEAGCINDHYKNGFFDAESKKNRCDQLRKKRNEELIGMMTLLEKNPNSLDHFNSIIVE